MRLSLFARVGLLVVLTTTPALAEAPSPSLPVPPSASAQKAASDEVEAVEQLYAKLEYEDANARAERLLTQRGLSHDLLIRATRIVAVTHAVLDHDDRARDAFTRLLALDPDFQVDPNLGPRVSGPFLEARGYWRAQPSRPGIEAKPTLSPGEKGSVHVIVRDPTKLAKRVVLYYRWGATGDMRAVVVSGNDSIAVTSAPPPNKARFDYYLQGFDEHDNVVMERGSPSGPLSAFLSATRGPNGSKSVFSSPAFWIISGAVAAVGGATALIIATRPEAPATSSLMRPSLICGGTDPCR
ncbi:MAG: hypothetical protein U0174_20405 [Polyangiaceae bacterium]